MSLKVKDFEQIKQIKTEICSILKYKSVWSKSLFPAGLAVKLARTGLIVFNLLSVKFVLLARISHKHKILGFVRCFS